MDTASHTVEQGPPLGHCVSPWTSRRPDWVVGNKTTASCDGQREPGCRIDWRLAAAALTEPGVGRRRHWFWES